MKLCLCVLSSLLPVVLTAVDFKVEVVTNVTRVTEGENFFIRCIVYGVPDLHFLDSSNTSVNWIFQRKNRVEILGQLPRLFQPKYEINSLKWNRTFSNNTFYEARNFTIDIYKVTETDKGVYTCVVSTGSEVVKRNLNLTDETVDSSLMFIDYAVSREDADKRCSFFGFRTPESKATEHELSSIMQPNETVWTFIDEDRYVNIMRRQWLSIRGCYHKDVTKYADFYENCDLVFHPPGNMSTYIGIQNTSCYVLLKKNEDIYEDKLPESLCNWTCTDVIETSCGGPEAVSLYKVIHVNYVDFGGFKSSDEKECNSLFLTDFDLPYQRITCRNTSTCTTLCVENTSNNKNEIYSISKYRDSNSSDWINAWELCRENNANLLDERGNITIKNDEFPCLGIFKSKHLLLKEMRLGVLNKKENGGIVLESMTERKKKFPFICKLLNEAAVRRNDSDESSTSTNILVKPTQDSFNMLIIIIPTSLLGLIILVTVVICVILRLKKTKKKENMPSEESKDDIEMEVVTRNENEEPDEYDVLRQGRQTTHNVDLYDHAKGQSSGIYDVTIRDKALLHDNTIPDNLYDNRIKTAVKHDECDMN